MNPPLDELGLVQTAVVTPQVTVADVDANVEAIRSALADLAGRGVRLAVFPELSITAYTCGDLVDQSLLLDAGGS